MTTPESDDAYRAWRIDCDVVQRSYADWKSAASPRWLRHMVYEIAVDREEAAARRYQDTLDAG